MKARKRETQHKRHRKRGTVTLAPAWGRGWGGARREPALSAAPGSTPSHEVSLSQIFTSFYLAGTRKNIEHLSIGHAIIEQNW